MQKLFIRICLILAVLQLSGLSVAVERSVVPVVKLPIEDWTVVAASKGWIQAAYAKYGSSVQLVDPGTTRINGAEASVLDRGDLHFASRMIYPATQHKVSGVDAVIVWLSEKSNPYAAPLMALSTSPINNIQDLKGKTFSASRIGCGYTSPYEMFQEAKLPLDTNLQKGQVHYANMLSGTGLTQALLAGRVDAIGSHVALTNVAPLVIQGLVKVVGRSPANGAYVNYAGRTTYFAMKKFADEHPELVKVFLEEREKTNKWIESHVDEASAIVAQATRVPQSVVKFGISDASCIKYWKGEPSYTEATNSIKQFQKYYIAHGDDLLTRRHLSDEQIAGFIDKRFFKGGEYSVYD